MLSYLQKTAIDDCSIKTSEGWSHTPEQRKRAREQHIQEIMKQWKKIKEMLSF